MPPTYSGIIYIRFKKKKMSIHPSEQIPGSSSGSNLAKSKLTETQLSSESPERPPKCGFISRLMENMVFQTIITLITILSLFMEDIRIIAFDKALDRTIDGANIAFIIIFSAEIVMSLTVSGYFCSFFFFLDILSTASILMDISMLTNLLYTSDGSGSFQLNILITQSKASRAAARAVRVMKIFRLTRVVKLYKSAIRTKQLKAVSEKEKRKQELRRIQLDKMKEALKMEERENDSKSVSLVSNGRNLATKPEQFQILDEIVEDSKEDSGENEEVEDALELPEEDTIDKINKDESKIGKLLSESTIKKVIVVILFLMFSVPVFDIDNYYPESTGWDFLVGFVAKALKDDKVPLAKINQVVTDAMKSKESLEIYSTIIIFETPFAEMSSHNAESIDSLRITDIGISESEVDVEEILARRPSLSRNGNDNFITVIVDYREFNKLDSIFSMVKIIFICLIIMYLLSSFNEHTSELIINPIEKMVEEIRSKGEADNADFEKVEEKSSNNFETTNVHQAITKISFLMMKVFGSIAFQTIYRKIFNPGSLTENYLEEGKHQFFIFGTCAICEYDKIAAILKEEAFELSNSVAKYLHSAAYRYGGTSVANNGGHFLIVFADPSSKEQRKDNSLGIFADFSVYSFVKTIVKINKEHEFFRYRKDSRLVSQMGDNFQIKITCTLHAGWAYEGLMGSPYKLDPTYISKSLIELQALGTFTREFHNSLLLTGEVQKMLTPELKKLARILDSVEVEGLGSTLELYMIDLDLQNISPPKTSLEKKHLKKEKNSIELKRELNLDYVRKEAARKNYHAMLFIGSKKELKEVMKNVFKEEYRKKYALIHQQYEAGQWLECRENLQDLFLQNKEDILAERIYHLIDRHNFQPPPDKLPLKCGRFYSLINK